MNEKTIKLIGIIATVVGMGATLVSSWVEDKKMEDKIEEKVNDYITNHFNENGSL